MNNTKTNAIKPLVVSHTNAHLTAVEGILRGPDGEPVCNILVYGYMYSDVLIIGGKGSRLGSWPFRQAVKRLGLNPDRYRVSIFEIKPVEWVKNKSCVQSRKDLTRNQ